ncbi:transglycosylase domain-containing protein [Aquisalibacillus elongatus]|uniref:Penicillin-binding protein n=1 Tax=Aquisalibacillus elongatus TaxID=485577 RepID=A0A3N5BCJ1_9BACI|nr:transglycosylase domain-containing protein [Aquisalibacillus elongatus]RPF55334.1 penicillin-binding protein [Aquisalibacillus elongatus]
MKRNERKNRWLAVFQEGKFISSTRITLDVLWHVALFFIVIGLIAMFFMAGTGFGYFASLVQDIPTEKKEDMRDQVYNYEETSHIYFANNVHMGELRSDLHREEIALDEVSKELKMAIKATEDEYFETHNGIVPKAIMRALYQEFAGTDMQSGGSTLTQQLIKSQILTNEVSFERKAKEILIALRLENFFNKDEIFEAYLNIVPFGRDSSGRNIAGVQAAAQGLFDVDASELNLAQAAFIAGLPQSPSIYTPFDGNGNVKPEESLEDGLERQIIVLNRMRDEGIIDEETYNEAREYDTIGNLTDKNESTISEYPFLTLEIESRAKDIMVEHLAEQDGYTKEDLNNDDSIYEQYEIIAERNLRQNGYDIHTTINKEIFDRFQDVTDEYSYFRPTHTVTRTDPDTGESYQEEVPVEAGAMLRDNKTGAIIAYVGGRDYERSQMDHVFYYHRPNGSTMKPLASYAPAMDMGYLHPGSPLADVKFGDSLINEHGGWGPTNFCSSCERGIESARTALVNSHNLPATRLSYDLANKRGMREDISNYLINQGFSEETFAPNRIATPTPLGGDSVYLKNTTDAYSVFANQGKFIESYMIDKIVDDDGNSIYEHEVEETEVFSPQTAYLTLDILRDVLTEGTATYLRSQLTNQGVDWAGKTGTSDHTQDLLFIGTNPNVTLGTWIGYDTYDYNGDGTVSDYEKQDIMNLDNCSNCSLPPSYRNQGYWAELANAATEVDPDLMAPSENHQNPGGIVSRSYCQLSGDLPSEACEELGLVSTDLFNIEHVPDESDDSVIEGRYVQIGDEYYEAIDETPEDFTEEGFFLRPGFIEEQGWGDIDDLSKLLPDNEVWENLIVPEDETLDDNGAPSSPSGLGIDGNTLSWSDSEQDVIGYHVYMAPTEEDEFELVGSTKDTSFELPRNNSVYVVMAVDYHGHESDFSNEIVYGSIEPPEEEEEEEDDEDNEDSDEEGNSDEQNDGDVDDDNSNDNDNNNDGNSNNNDDSGSNENNDSTQDNSIES